MLKQWTFYAIIYSMILDEVLAYGKCAIAKKYYLA